MSDTDTRTNADLLLGQMPELRELAQTIITTAHDAVPEYELLGKVFVDLQPGDSTSYKLLLAKLPAAGAANAGGECAFARINGQAAAFAFTPTGLWMPDYLSSVGFGNDHTAQVLALFLTAFSDRLDEIRADA